MNSVFIDPRTKYPTPNFPAGSQSIPGTEQEMTHRQITVNKVTKAIKN